MCVGGGGYSVWNRVPTEVRPSGSCDGHRAKCLKKDTEK